MSELFKTPMQPCCLPLKRKQYPPRGKKATSNLIQCFQHFPVKNNIREKQTIRISFCFIINWITTFPGLAIGIVCLKKEEHEEITFLSTPWSTQRQRSVAFLPCHQRIMFTMNNGMLLPWRSQSICCHLWDSWNNWNSLKQKKKQERKSTKSQQNWKKRNLNSFRIICFHLHLNAMPLAVWKMLTITDKVLTRHCRCLLPWLGYGKVSFFRYSRHRQNRLRQKLQEFSLGKITAYEIFRILFKCNLYVKEWGEGGWANLLLDIVPKKKSGVTLRKLFVTKHRRYADMLQDANLGILKNNHLALKIFLKN